MSEQNAKPRGCLRITCLGCLVLVGLAVLGGAGSIFLMTSKPEVARGEGAKQQVVWDDAQVSVGPEIVWTVPPHPDLPAASLPAGRVELDLAYGEFVVEPAEPGEGPSVDADYDENDFTLEQRLQTRPDGSWVYRVGFDKKGGLFTSTEANNRVRIFLPRDRAFELVGSIGLGESRLELGGLDLTRIALDAGMGAHELHFSEPSPRPLESLSIASSMGEVLLNRVGNASPARVDVGHRMGQVELDLRGDWRNDATIEGRLSMGELLFRVPDHVNVDPSGLGATMGDRNVARGLGDRELGPEAHTLRLEGRVFMGGVRVR